MTNKLRHYRTERNISQQELARQIGIHKDYISMIERSARTPGFSLAKKLADFFSVTVDELFFCPHEEQIIRKQLW